jgi:hypothetical protein
MCKEELLYALCKQVPDMEHGFVIDTNYGRLCIDADMAAPIMLAVKKAIEIELAHYALQLEAA